MIFGKFIHREITYFSIITSVSISHNAFFAISCYVTGISRTKEVFCKTEKKNYTLVYFGKLRYTTGEFSSKNELFGVHTTHYTKNDLEVCL